MLMLLPTQVQGEVVACLDVLSISMPRPPGRLEFGGSSGVTVREVYTQTLSRSSARGSAPKNGKLS
jgi:hypothetical protein